MLASISYLNYGSSFASESLPFAYSVAGVIVIFVILALIALVFDNLFLPWQEAEAEVIALISLHTTPDNTEGFIPVVNPAIPKALIPIPLSVLEDNGDKGKKHILFLDFLGQMAKLPVSQKMFGEIGVGMKLRLKFQRSRIRQKFIAVKIVEVMP